MVSTPPYLVRLQLKEGAGDGREYPFNLPLIRCLDIEFSSPVTFFVGENGTGKSTVIEAIAALCKLPVSGGGRNELAGHHGPDATSPLAKSLRPSFRRRPPDAYFLRAELQAHFARCSMRATPTRTSGWGRSVRALRGTVAAYPVPWRSLSGDSPEPDSVRAPAVRRAGVRAPPQRQLALLAHMSALVAAGTSQFIIATHSPILLTFPGAQILSFDGDCLRPASLEDTSHFQITKGILQNPAVYWKHLQHTAAAEDTPWSTGPDREFVVVLKVALERMANNNERDTVGRFSDRAADYVRYRPAYPAESVDAILAGLGPPARLVAADVGAGTGISARLLANQGFASSPSNRGKACGAQPNRTRTWRGWREEPKPRDYGRTLAHLVLCAQSFHWFRTAEALPEFARILKD